MRLDLVLKQSGIIKRRTIAKALAENGKVFINRRVGKPSSEVKDGDVLTLHLGNKVVDVVIHFELRYKREFPVFEEIKNSDA